MLDEFTPLDPEQQYSGSFQELADARRALKVSNELARLALPTDERLELARIRSRAIRCIEAATAELIETLDVALGDPDCEDDEPAEPNGDETDGAWIEWDRMHGSQKGGPNIAAIEDDEEDIEDRGDFEDEPLLDGADCDRLNALFGDGPGGGQQLDSDNGWDGD